MKRITRISIALLSGLLLAAAWPTNGFTPLIFVALVPLLFLQDYIGSQQMESTSSRVVESQSQQVDTKKSSVYGLAFLTFLVWNTLTTWWVWNSTPVGSIAMLLLNSALMAFFFWLYHFTRKNVFKNKNGFFLLILSFLAFEYLHYNWQLNWPWLTLGNVFSHHHTWIQWYEFTGVAGGTIWVLAANLLFYNVIKSITQQVGKFKSQKLIANSLIFLAVVFIPIIISKIMYNSYEEKDDEVEVVVVQPNIDPWNEEFSLSTSEILERNLKVADTLITDKTRFVVSPESSIHENIWLERIDRYYSIRELKLFSKMNDITYIIGASTLGMTTDKDDFAARKFYDVDEYYYAYNSALSINDTSDIQIHQKSRLTPGVEMMPSWWFLRPIKNLAIDLGGTVGTLKSEDEVTIFTYKDSETQKYKIAPLICYESVFGGYVTEFVRKGANIIFVITNDGWWGNTPGHRQHFEMSKLRAIENRRSIARSANTGISGFINQRGDVVEQTNYWEPAALRNVMNVNDDMTFYSKHGDYLYRVGTFVAILVLCFSIVTSVLKKRV